MGLWTESWKLALSSLRANKLRTFLTLVGNIIGVMFVIAILSITQGMTHYVSDKILDQGSNVFSIERIGIVTSWDEFVEKNKRKALKIADYEALRANGVHFARVGAGRSRAVRVKHLNRNVSNIQMRGITSDHPDSEKDVIESGRHLVQSDIDRRRTVVVIGHDVQNDVFQGEDPIGKELRVGSMYYTVIGVVEKKGSLLGASQDDFVKVPLSAFEKQFGTDEDLSLTIQAKDQAGYLASQDEARSILRVQRKVAPQAADDFDLLTSEMFMQIYNTFTAGAYMTMIILAGISLVVGGIVIMNIMLVSVTERTREIGIRKAIGARRIDMLRQFLIEALVMGLAGGLIGVLMGVGLAKVVEAVSPLPAVIQPWVVLLGMSMAAGVGLFFGVWPAAKASKLDPIAALRFE